MLYLIRGLPGSGKTTLGEMLSACGVVTVNISADDFFTDIKGDYVFEASRLGLAHKACQDRVNLYLAEGWSVAVSNTFTTEKEMEPYFELAKNHGHEVTVLIVENRHGNKSIHDVPEETIQKMKNRFSIKL